MKLLIASATLNAKNGYGNITHELLQVLHDMGHEITLLLPEDDTNSEYDIAGVQIERVLPKSVISYKRLGSVSHLFWEYKTNKKFDVVWSLFAFPYAPLMCREAKRKGVPFVVGAQGTYGVEPLTKWPERFFMKWAYENAKAIIVPSEYTKNAILEESGENYDIAVVHNGVNFKRFADYALKKSVLNSVPKDTLVLLTVGEVKKRKGQDIVIRALPEVIKKHPNVLYVIVGYPTSQDEYMELAKELGVDKNILITGPASDEDILEYYHRCDVYVHTPRVHDYHFEGFGIVYIEAGACGKPSVALDAGGIRDAVVDGETGLVADSEEGVTKRIISLLDDDKKRCKMGKDAQDYAKSHDWKNIAEQYSSLLKKI